MSFAAYNSHSNEIFIDLGLVKVRDLISMNQLKLVYDFHNNHLPSDLMSLFVLSSDVHTQSRDLNSTINRLLHIPAVKTTTYGLVSIKYQCAKLWNSMFKFGEINVDDDKTKYPQSSCVTPLQEISKQLGYSFHKDVMQKMFSMVKFLQLFFICTLI